MWRDEERSGTKTHKVKFTKNEEKVKLEKREREKFGKGEEKERKKERLRENMWH